MCTGFNAWAQTTRTDANMCSMISDNYWLQILGILSLPLLAYVLVLRVRGTRQVSPTPFHWALRHIFQAGTAKPAATDEHPLDPTPPTDRLGTDAERSAQRSIDSHEAALVIVRDLGNRQAEAATLGNLGLSFAALGKTRQAIQTYKQHLVIAREVGDRRAEGEVLTNLGLAYAELCEPERAIECHQSALEIFREAGELRAMSQVLHSLGDEYAELGESGHALEYYEQQLDLTVKLGDRRGEARAWWNMGPAYAKLGDLDFSLDCMQLCVDYERKHGLPNAEVHAARVAELRAQRAFPA